MAEIKKDNIVYLNGETLPAIEAKISVFDYGFLFGAGVYDVALVYDQALFQINEHLDRFFRSAAELKMPIRDTKEHLLSVCKDLVKINNLQNGIVYLQATYGAYGKRSHKFPEKFDNPTILIFTQDLAVYPTTYFTVGVDVVTEPEYRWQRCNVKSVGLLPALLSTNALPPSATECIFYDEEKRTVRECASSNIFCVKDGVIYTPPLSKYILPGIERQTTVNIARENNMPLKEEDISIEFLKDADEVFMTSTTKEVLPIKKVDDVEIKNTPGPITRKLIELFVYRVEKEIGFVHPKRKIGLF